MNADTNLLAAMSALFQTYPEVEKAVLFGSRSRGDNYERSDYDVAVYGVLTKEKRAALRYSLEEELPTLHKIDLVFMHEQRDERFIQNVQKEGVVIYDQNRE